MLKDYYSFILYIYILHNQLSVSDSEEGAQHASASASKGRLLAKGRGECPLESPFK